MKSTLGLFEQRQDTEHEEPLGHLVTYRPAFDHTAAATLNNEPVLRP